MSSGKDCLRIAATVMMQRHKEGESVQKVTKHAGMWSKEREDEGGREEKKTYRGIKLTRWRAAGGGGVYVRR